ncbi:hypothetical protein JHD50_10805 [Sulfurimonas sp. MAG313]|nr:hypothetical protein [Sulfurimonas sp. MAG313]MDF1881781.1 hypothetical protein [Sulfurimonas sp. MAG313]
MEGQVEVSFTVLCENDFNKEIRLNEILKSEKVLKAIKSEFCEGARNLTISSEAGDVKVSINSEKKEHMHIIEKDDIQDILELTEEYARSQKLLKGACTRIELKNFKTI